MSKLTIEQLLNHCSATCEKEGLWGNVHGIRYQEHDSVREYLKELQHYKNLEEQGKLKVQVQVHGLWEILTDEYDCEYMLCTACGKEFYPIDEDTVDITYNYCPNCGAKMEG